MALLYSRKLSEFGSAEESLLRLPLQWRAALERHKGIKLSKISPATPAALLLVYECGARGTLYYTKEGKPRLIGGPAISISHTKRYVFCAIAEGEDSIGVDAEEYGRNYPHGFAPLAARWFVEGELTAFKNDPTERTFLRLWTQKEAFGKYCGEGLAAHLKEDTASPELLHCVQFEYSETDEYIVTVCRKK